MPGTGHHSRRMTATDPSVFDWFAGYDTGTISDALESLGLYGALPGITPLTIPRTVVGSASTVQLGSDDGTPSSRHLCAGAIDSSGATSVIVVAGGRLDCGGWGGLLSRSAVRRGIRGVIVDGFSRDIDEAIDLGCPEFARGTTPVTARGRQREISSGDPVRIGDVPISQGDIVVADRTGVVIVPRSRTDDVLAAAGWIADKEKALAERIDAGEPTERVMGGQYESMLHAEGLPPARR